MEKTVNLNEKNIKVQYKTSGRFIYFETPEMLTEKEAALVQMELGYHPAGYSFEGYSASPESGTLWMCYSSCD